MKTTNSNRYAEQVFIKMLETDFYIIQLVFQRGKKEWDNMLSVRMQNYLVCNAKKALQYPYSYHCISEAAKKVLHKFLFFTKRQKADLLRKKNGLTLKQQKNA